MKKVYRTPVLDIEKFDIVDVITDSAAVVNDVVTSNDAAMNATDNHYQAAVGVEW